MGDRQTFQVMPSAADGDPPLDRAARRLPFRHANEVAAPHRYAVTFENGIKTEIAPTDHAALMRFTFPGDSSSLVFDNVDNRWGMQLDANAGVLTGWTETRSGLSNGATRMFFYATFDRPITGSGARFARFDGRTVNMRIATSLIGTEQAKRNLELELAASDTIESVSARAQELWDRKLGVIEVEGASEDPLTTLYSNLYRLSLYPNSGHENTGTAASPRWEHAVQSTASSTPPASTPTQTGAPIRPGKVHVNNGFWDTYRTAWSAYSLFDAGTAGELVDGFVQQYRDGGWISRWSSPGYANLMTGTSSDVSFADAHVKGDPGLRRPRRLRRGGPQRHRGAAGRPVQQPGRPQGPDRVDLPRLHAVARVRGRLVGPRGRDQRLRDREHGRALADDRASSRPTGAATARRRSTSAVARRTT